MKVEEIFNTPLGYHYFQGYYDIRPTSQFDTLIAVGRADFYDRLPSPNDRLELGFFDYSQSKTEFQKIGETFAWNWQQGSKLQFLDRGDKNDWLLYNSIDDGTYISIWKNIVSDEIQISPAMYSVSKNAAVGVSINFERHYFFKRGYSYGCTSNEQSKSIDRENLSVYCTSTFKRLYRFNIEDIRDLFPDPIQNVDNWLIEHPQVSDDGNFVAFMVRYYQESGETESILFCLNVGSGNISRLLNSGRVSHYNWTKEGNLVAYCSPGNTVIASYKKLQRVKFLFKFTKYLYKKFIPIRSNLRFALTNDQYVLVDPNFASISATDTCTKEDGHPSYSATRGMFVTDTYPENGHQKLLLADLTEKNRQALSFKSNNQVEESPYRCDLHPKVDFDKKLISIDTFEDKFRSTRLFNFK